MKPLLVIDGDSLAHRAYHALPKTIKRAGGKQSGAIVGFTNFIVRLWEAEQPRSVVVGWDTLEVPTYRHEAYPTYQSGRVFDVELLEQLAILPELVRSLGFVVGKAPGYEADDFLASAAGAEEARGGETLVVTSDPTRIRQILLNFVGNAVKFTPSGSVSVTLQVVGRTGEQGRLRLEVEDTGVGIPEHAKPLVLVGLREVETEGTRSFGSSGLGLTICRQIIEHFGGRIWVEGAEPRGAVFRFTLPAAPAERARRAAGRRRA